MWGSVGAVNLEPPPFGQGSDAKPRLRFPGSDMEKRNPVTSHYLIFPEVTWKHVIPLLFLLSNVTLESDTSNVNRKRKTATTEFMARARDGLMPIPSTPFTQPHTLRLHRTH